MSKRPPISAIDDAALRVVLNVRETEQMKALKEENEKLKRELKVAVEVGGTLLCTMLKMYGDRVSTMQASGAITTEQAERLRQIMAAAIGASSQNADAPPE